MAEKVTKNKRAPQPAPNGQPSGPRRWISILFYTLGFAVLGFYLFGNKDGAGMSKELSYTKMTAYIEVGAIEKIEVADDYTASAHVKPQSYTLVFGTQGDGERAKGVLKAQVPSIEEFSKYMDTVNAARKEKGQAAIDVKFTKSHDYLYLILVNILPFVLMILFFVYLSRGIGGAAGGLGSIFGVGKAQAQLFDKEKKDKVTFEDVAGLYGAKQEVQEIVEVLKKPKKYTESGSKRRRGRRLAGCWGTGKAVLVKEG